MRLAIVGKTRSGKSTALHRFLSHALRHPWAGVLLLDGKGCELHHYANLPGVTYYGMDEIDRWAAALTAHVTRMATRTPTATPTPWMPPSDEETRIYTLVAGDVYAVTITGVTGNQARVEIDIAIGYGAPAPSPSLGEGRGEGPAPLQFGRGPG